MIVGVHLTHVHHTYIMYVAYVHLLCISQSLREAAALGVRSVSLSPAGIGDQLTAPRRRREGRDAREHIFPHGCRGCTELP